MDGPAVGSSSRLDLAARPTAALADWACGLSWDDIPPRVRERTKDLLLDAVGCALAADRAEEMPTIERFATQLADGTGATVIGRARGSAPGSAALLNGYRITALTACDVYTPAHFHVTPEVVPPALAVAEDRRSTGRQLVVALAAGFEVATRVASGLDYPSFRARGWHTPGVAGPFGGAAAAARLLGLGPLATVHSMGLAGSQAAGTWAAWGTPTVKFHQARAALSALMAALLAETGFTSSDEVLAAADGGILRAYAGGGRPHAIADRLGSRWELERISLRPWPGATPVQPVITVLMRHVASGRLPDRTVHARVFVSPAVHGQHARFHDPSGMFEALLSIHYATAAIMARGRLGFDEYAAAAYSDPAIQSILHERVELVADPALDPLAARVDLVGARGETASEAVSVPRGHPDDPADRALLAEKFLACATPVLGTGRARRLYEALAAVEAVDDVADLCELLRPAA